MKVNSMKREKVHGGQAPKKQSVQNSPDKFNDFLKVHCAKVDEHIVNIQKTYRDTDKSIRRVAAADKKRIQRVRALALRRFYWANENCPSSTSAQASRDLDLSMQMAKSSLSHTISLADKGRVEQEKEKCVKYCRSAELFELHHGIAKDVCSMTDAHAQQAKNETNVNGVLDMCRALCGADGDTGSV